MLRAPSRFNGTFINRHFFPAYFKHQTLSAINSGRCYDWAYFAHRLFGAELWSTDYHAWVQYEGRHFDSETHKGVRSFMDLRCNRRNAFPVPWDDHGPSRMKLQNFKDFWDEEGGGRRRHWDSILEADLRRILGKRFSELTPIFPKKIQPARIMP